MKIILVRSGADVWGFTGLLLEITIVPVMRRNEPRNVPGRRAALHVANRFSRHLIDLALQRRGMQLRSG